MQELWIISEKGLKINTPKNKRVLDPTKLLSKFNYKKRKLTFLQVLKSEKLTFLQVLKSEKLTFLQVNGQFRPK